MRRRGAGGGGGGDADGVEPASAGGDDQEVRELRRADEGQSAVQPARAVVLQLPEAREGQPLPARLHRHHQMRQDARLIQHSDDDDNLSKYMKQNGKFNIIEVLRAAYRGICVCIFIRSQCKSQQ